jgi:DNA-binding CsgD family transcriptional regulator
VRNAGLDTPSALETLAKLYGLTGSEVRVLQGIVDIGGIPKVAKSLGISEGTTKTHLKGLFAKTGTHRQADLVKLVAGVAGPFHKN